MKKLIALLLIAAAFITIVGCGPAAEKTDNGKKNIVTTIFPQYDFVRQIAGDKVNIKMLISPGAEVHEYSPLLSDIAAINSCDLFIYVGGVSDSWVDDITESLDNKDKIKFLTLLSAVNAVEEETVEGMEAEEEEQEEGSGPELDEHVWTSPANAIRIVSAIKDSLCEIDPENADYYSKNAADYTAGLLELDNDFKSTVANGKRNTLIFAERFPLRYFAEEFGLKYFAAFPGCSSDTEPSLATVSFLVNKIKTENIPVVFYIEFSTGTVADTICAETGTKKLLFHSCHNVTKEEWANGATYISLMRQNVINLREALA